MTRIEPTHLPTLPGPVFRSLRKQVGSAAAVARALGVHRNSIVRWEATEAPGVAVGALLALFAIDVRGMLLRVVPRRENAQA